MPKVELHPVQQEQRLIFLFEINEDAPSFEIVETGRDSFYDAEVSTSTGFEVVLTGTDLSFVANDGG